MKVTPLKTKIIESGLKQCGIAEALDIEETLMSKYVAGRRKVPLEIQKKLAKHLKAKQADLFPEGQ